MSQQDLLQAAFRAHQAGDLAEAQRHVNAVLAKAPQDPFGLHVAGLIARDAGRANEAVRFMKASIQNHLPNRNKAEFANNLGRLYQSQGLSDLALKLFDFAKQIDQSFLPPRRLRVDVLCELGRYADAIIEAKQLIALQSTATHWLALAQASKAALDWPATKAAAEEVLKRDPAHLIAQHLLAIAMSHLGPIDRAIVYFQKQADDPDIMCSLAIAFMEDGQVEAALETLDKALALAPYLERALTAKCELLWMMGEKDRASAPLEDACRTAPENQFLRLTLAATYQQLGCHEDALHALQTAMAMTPGHPLILMQMAANLAELGHLNEALEHARTAVHAWPEHEAILRDAATLMMRAGALDEAMKLCEIGCELRPWSYDWIALTSSVQRGLGDPRYKYWFDFEAFVQASSIDCPSGYSSIAAYNIELAQWLRSRHTLKQHPLINSLRGGSQIRLPTQPGRDPMLDAFFEAIDGPIERYIATLRSLPNHPFAKRITKGWRLSGLWSVQLKDGGSHVNHIHPDGWLSSAYYVDVPDSVSAHPNKDGWIGFGAPRFPAPNIDHEKWIEPKAGNLALFPSYMWHGVKPFRSAQTRLTMAFDVVPL